MDIDGNILENKLDAFEINCDVDNVHLGIGFICDEAGCNLSQ